MISNASDALDKIRFMSLTDKGALKDTEELSVKIKVEYIQSLSVKIKFLASGRKANGKLSISWRNREKKKQFLSFFCSDFFVASLHENYHRDLGIG